MFHRFPSARVAAFLTLLSTTTPGAVCVRETTIGYALNLQISISPWNVPSTKSCNWMANWTWSKRQSHAFEPRILEALTFSYTAMHRRGPVWDLHRRLLWD